MCGSNQAELQSTETVIGNWGEHLSFTGYLSKYQKVLCSVLDAQFESFTQLKPPKPTKLTALIKRGIVELVSGVWL